jgi:Capsule polysaccharide biosynthesis protein
MTSAASIPPMPKAVVFFARDFLAQEFSKIGLLFSDYSRVYITANQAEIRTIKQIDPNGEICQIVEESATLVNHNTSRERGFNDDRVLRLLGTKQLSAIVGPIEALCSYLTAKYDIRYYFDEPVSGFANFAFNRAFTSAGAVCLHFQSSWIPGFMFFTSDQAQRLPVALYLEHNNPERVKQHVEARRDGLARPLYVLNYGSVRKRLVDIFGTLSKVVYRRLFRRAALYIDRDVQAHLFHLRSLVWSFLGRYSRDLAAGKYAELRYVVFPLHYEPEAVLNYFSKFQRQEEIAAQILDSLPLGYELILKEHPSQPGALHSPKWASLRKSRRVILLRGDYDARRLFSLRPITVSIASTFALEAAVAGCPVGVLGGVHFLEMPGIMPLSDPAEWTKLLNATPASIEDIVRWYERFLAKYCFEGNFMRGQTTLPQLNEMVKILTDADKSR